MDCHVLLTVNAAGCRDIERGPWRHRIDVASHGKEQGTKDQLRRPQELRRERKGLRHFGGLKIFRYSCAVRAANLFVLVDLYRGEAAVCCAPWLYRAEPAGR
jgi:hypothetical protein